MRLSPHYTPHKVLLWGYGFYSDYMTRDEFIVGLRNFYQGCVAISELKNRDYATHDDPFKNFHIAEAFGIRADKAILVRLSDKMSRIAQLLDKPPSVRDESLKDTLRDMANYLAILSLLLEANAPKDGS